MNRQYYNNNSKVLIKIDSIQLYKKTSLKKKQKKTEHIIYIAN